MQPTSRAILFLATFLALLCLLIVLGEHWVSSTPPRPQGVPGDAAFLRYPYTGFPGPPRGRWMFCWHDNEQVQCRVSTKEGQTLFEGPFLPADKNKPFAQVELAIDPDKTSDEQSLWTGIVHVPLVRLRSGGVLIPAFGYERGKNMLDGGGPPR